MIGFLGPGRNGLWTGRTHLLPRTNLILYWKPGWENDLFNPLCSFFTENVNPVVYAFLQSILNTTARGILWNQRLECVILLRPPILCKEKISISIRTSKFYVVWSQSVSFPTIASLLRQIDFLAIPWNWQTLTHPRTFALADPTGIDHFSSYVQCFSHTSFSPLLKCFLLH